MSSAKSTGRLAGLFWLMFIVTTGFSLVYARNALVVPGDPSATIDRISSLEGLYRAAIASTLLSQIFWFMLGLALFHLFRPVSRLWATIVLASAAISVAVAIASSIASYGILILVNRQDHLAAFDADQIRALATIFLGLGNSAQGLLEIFWTPFFFAFGLLVIRSKMLPAALGVLLIVMSVGYFINVFTKLLVPDFHPALMTELAVFPGALGTFLTTLWLLVMGAKECRTTESPAPR